jgi:hypothetical protein
MEYRICEKNNKYKVNQNGDVIGPRGTVLKGFIHPKGYKHVFLGNGDCSKVHRLVAQAFIPNPENKKEVNHIDGNKLNNHVSNLEWVTHTENMRHASKNGLYNPSNGSKNGNSYFTEEQVKEIRNTYIARHPQFSGSALAKKYGVSGHAISYIINRGWKHLTN